MAREKELFAVRSKIWIEDMDGPVPAETGVNPDNSYRGRIRSLKLGKKFRFIEHEQG